MSKPANWRFTATSGEAWKSMLDSCRKAKKSIDIEQFAVGTDGFVEELASVLESKARAGVRVRLLFDAVGSFMFLYSSVCQELREAGAGIVFHSTVIPHSFRRFFPFFLRDHRKLVVVDEQEAHIGGVILQERARDWRDTNVLLTGSIVHDCATQFEMAWRRAKRMSPLGQVLSDDGKSEFYLAGNSFRLRNKDLYRSVVRSVSEAKLHVHITTPYFWLTRDMRRALRFAQAEGADIVILLPRRSDNLWADILGRFFYRWLLKRRMNIFHYDKTLLHAKTIVVDNKWATVGSYNLDWLSTWLNYELNVVSTSERFTNELNAMFSKDISESREVTLQTSGWYGFFGEG